MNWTDLLDLSSVFLGPAIQAAGTPTATGTLTSTVEPTVTSVVVLPPTVTVPAVAGTLSPNPFSPDYIFSAGDAVAGPYSTGLLVLSLILLAAGVYFFFFEKRRWQRGNALRYRATNSWGLYALVLGIVGSLLVLLRWLGVPGMTLHFWLYLMLLVIIGFAAYAAYYFFVQYPRLAAAARRQSGARGARATTRARAAGGTGTASSGGAPAAPAAPKGNPGNPRGTSPRGERRRAKK